MFEKTVRNINRIREFINILLKYGFEDLVANSALKRFIPNQANWLRDDKPVLAYSRWERVRMVMEELGTTFIKFAQTLSNRPDLLPEGLITEFEKLQANAPAVDINIIKQTIKQELGRNPEEIFSFFDEKPLAAASIGQVHKATLPTGESVVVKIQRPDAKRQVSTDLSLLRDVVRMTESYFKKFGIFNPLEIVDTFEKSMQRELDYMQELKNMERFRKIYKDRSNFHIPFPYRNFCTSKILTTEYIQGCKITDVAQLEVWGLEPKQIVERGLDIYLTQIFEYGFFHADPHAGNILVRPNGTIVLIDFGMVGKLLKHHKYAFAGVFVGFANQDPKAMARNMRTLSPESPIADMPAFEGAMQELIEEFIVFGDPQAGLAEFTVSLQNVIYQYKLQIPGAIFLILRALAILEGISKSLYPEFETINHIKPYGLKMLSEQFSFRNQRNELVYSISQGISLLYAFPAEIKSILHQIRHGELNINILQKGQEEREKKQEIQTTRLSWVFLLGIFWLSTALTWQVSTFFSLTSFVFAILSGVGLFWQELRRK
jgi:ubiquinone biosynthesis protein